MGKEIENDLFLRRNVVVIDWYSRVSSGAGGWLDSTYKYFLKTIF